MSQFPLVQDTRRISYQIAIARRLHNLKLRVTIIARDPLVKIPEHLRALNAVALHLPLTRSNKANATIVTITIISLLNSLSCFIESNRLEGILYVFLNCLTIEH